MGRAITIQGRWRVAGASVIGKQHEQAGGQCEDAWSCARRALQRGHEVVAVCLSDGAGSAANGRAGARIVSRALAYWLVANADKVIGGTANDQKRVIVSPLKRVLRRAALRNGATLRSYACTVVATLTTTDGRWLTVHIGDGAIVGAFAGTLRIVSAPQKGEFANETFFVTDDDSLESVQIQSGEAGDPDPPPEAFALFTDGIEGLLINRRTGEISRVLADMFGWLKNNAESDVSAALDTNLKRVFRERTNDDCSLVLIVQ